MISKEELFEKGLILQKKFLEINNFKPIEVISIPKEELPVEASCGYYDYGDYKIHICIEACANTNPRYSFPSIYSDRTPYGVIQHETAHYVDYLLGITKNNKNLKEMDKPITNYCPNNTEWLAEMLRLYITNPNLLMLLRPKTYNYFFNELEIKSPVNTNWKNTIINLGGDERIMDRVKNKINKENKQLNEYSIGYKTDEDVMVRETFIDAYNEKDALKTLFLQLNKKEFDYDTVELCEENICNHGYFYN